MIDTRLRAQLQDFLDWESAHAGFDDAVKGIPPLLRGRVPAGCIVEHIRIAQHDILDFCRKPRYPVMAWPNECWPTARVAKRTAAWKRSLEGFRLDSRAMQRLAADPRIDLFSKIPHGAQQTYLRELLLVADHTIPGAVVQGLRAGEARDPDSRSWWCRPAIGPSDAERCASSIAR